MLVISKDNKGDIDLKKIRSIVKDSLEKSLGRVTLTTSDHRYHQGIYQVLSELDKLLQTP